MSSMEIVGISDLMYIGERAPYNQAIEEIKQVFPAAICKDGSDYIHEYRFSVDIAAVSQRDWMLWLLRNGWFECSLNYQLYAMGTPDLIKPLILQVIDERKATQS